MDVGNNTYHSSTVADKKNRYICGELREFGWSELKDVNQTWRKQQTK